MTYTPENTNACFTYDAPLTVPILDAQGALNTIELPTNIPAMNGSWSSRDWIPSEYLEYQRACNMTSLKLSVLSTLQIMFNEQNFKHFAERVRFVSINPGTSAGLLEEPGHHGTFGVGVG